MTSERDERDDKWGAGCRVWRLPSFKQTVLTPQTTCPPPPIMEDCLIFHRLTCLASYLHRHTGVLCEAALPPPPCLSLSFLLVLFPPNSLYRECTSHRLFTLYFSPSLRSGELPKRLCCEVASPTPRGAICFRRPSHFSLGGYRWSIKVLS